MNEQDLKNNIPGWQSSRSFTLPLLTSAFNNSSLLRTERSYPGSIMELASVNPSIPLVGRGIKPFDRQEMNLSPIVSGLLQS
jgi:hypothetical protein